MSKFGIGAKLAKELMNAEVFERGELWPNGQYEDCTVHAFKFGESRTDACNYFVLEAVCGDVVSGGEGYTSNNGKVIRTVKTGDVRSHVIKMNKKAAGGNVVQMLMGLFGSAFGMGENTPWQDRRTMLSLLKHFGVKAKTKGLTDEDVLDLLFGALTGEDQPLAGTPFHLRVFPNNAGTFTIHHYEAVGKSEEEDEEEDEEIPF